MVSNLPHMFLVKHSFKVTTQADSLEVKFASLLHNFSTRCETTSCRSGITPEAGRSLKDLLTSSDNDIWDMKASTRAASPRFKENILQSYLLHTDNDLCFRTISRRSPHPVMCAARSSSPSRYSIWLACLEPILTASWP